MSAHRNLRIAVVSGGPGSEAEVSRSSGREVTKALRAKFSNVELVELDGRIADSLREWKPDVVFPALHGPPGEDGTFQGFLEVLGIPYVGSGVRASAIATDKPAARELFRLRGLPVAEGLVVSRGSGDALRRIREALGDEVVIKPATQGSAIGVSFAHDAKSLEKGLAAAWELDSRVLVERRVVGKEITCGVLEREAPEALPVLEIRTPQGTWYDYEHRYTPGQSEHVVPAPLPRDRYDRIQQISLAAFDALGCRDLCRVDFVVPEAGDPVLLEVNTLPGMTATSLYPDEARAAGISFEDLVAHLVLRAKDRMRR